ncbi:hypothetical protein CEXT_310681 [Caerostris extrusa]|uniref:Uncharacterized protein n=1 Tax=Caerostris extrusa TaxID=172846 RepID=A0AAV4UAF9_CAEEX|nr:hypothetical protein CEXT_310681 [Caerostris extrusa]
MGIAGQDSFVMLPSGCPGHNFCPVFAVIDDTSLSLVPDAVQGNFFFVRGIAIRGMDAVVDESGSKKLKERYNQEQLQDHNQLLRACHKEGLGLSPFSVTVLDGTLWTKATTQN